MAFLLTSLLSKLGQWGGSATNIDRHKCERTVPLEVLVLGCSRSGTSSLRQALRDLGYHDVYHATALYVENPPDVDMWVEAFEAKYQGKGKKFGRAEWDKLLGHCMAITDAPCVPHFDEDLLAAYPEAKVILSLRDSPEQWWKSAESTIVPAMRDLVAPSTLWKRLYRAFLPKLPWDDYHTQLAKRIDIDQYVRDGPRVYSDHNDRIRRLVAGEADATGGATGEGTTRLSGAEMTRAGRAGRRRMLEYNVKQGWQPLCEFLGKPEPRDDSGRVVPFPRLNDTKEFQSGMRGLHIFMNVMVGINVALTAAGIATLAVGLQWFWKRRVAGY